MICRNCKKKILDKAKFCGYCGSKFEYDDIEVKKVDRKKQVLNLKNIMATVIIFTIIIGIGLINNKNNPYMDETIYKYDEQETNRENIVKYIKSFGGFVYFPNYLYFLDDSGLISILNSDEAYIYQELEVNQGVWYDEEDIELLNLDVDYWVEGNTRESIITTIVDGMQNRDGWAFYYEEINQYKMPYGDINLYYDVSRNCFSISILNDETNIEDLIYEYNLDTKEENINETNRYKVINEYGDSMTYKDYIGREISMIIGQLVPGMEG